MVTHTNDDPVEFFLSVLENQGNAKSFDEIGRLEHALQCATQAQQNGASPALVAASLLHDIGSILRSDYPELAGDLERGHEKIGAEVLGRWFGPAVTEPVALHILAKRYLLAKEPGYLEKLSEGSMISLKSQGLPLTPLECEEFLSYDFAEDSLALRRWDDDAKTPGAPTLELQHFKQHLVSCLNDGVPVL